ncbi:Signal transduction histidine kinase [Corynebacterium mycetoides]|uniref:Signal transduction histidine kinase n=1 Tax=Corynebacterium mycetoides TaxID=38302 RepID=A0A1G9PR92_9CORY|nr:histidine kinase [Corynebacterium mycetoides]SDM01229.1 Signal transduction histidine kinase [Corynebacterium mycetoides]
MSNTNRILAFLRVSLHVLVAVLLAVGLVNARGNLAALCLGAVFALTYLAGTVYHNEGRPYSRAAALGWLAVITALWLGMTLLSSSFVWLEFPLVILVSYVLPVGPGLVVSAGILAFTLSVTWPMSGVGGLIGPSIGTAVALLIVHSYTALRSETEHYKQLVVDLQAAQMELAAAEHEAGVAAERSRLSREVHDTIAQGLSSIVLLGRALDKQLDDPVKARATLDTIRATATDNLAEARRIVTGNAGSTEPLPVRVQRLARAAEERQRALGTELSVRVSAVGLPEPAAGVVESVVREGLSNIVRHAGATEAVVTVDTLGTQATVDVYDNGRGITGPEGYGLRGLRARVAEAGGELTIEGNVLAATVPLQGGLS